jgi:CheY-like chemotaxis protein
MRTCVATRKRPLGETDRGRLRHLSPLLASESRECQIPSAWVCSRHVVDVDNSGMNATDRPAKILVIDDDPDVRTLCRLNLSWAGHEVLEAGGGAEALEMVASETPDVLVLDIMMPAVDGLQVLRRVRNDPATAELPVVVISARVGTGDQVRGLETGADVYVTKPFNPETLTSMVECALGADADERRGWREARLRELAEV